MKRPSPKVFLLVVALAVPALAVVPQFWEVRTYEELSEGDLDGLSITGDGDLVLAPVFNELYDTGEPLVFSAVGDADGNVYLGTGHDGRVFRVDSDGNGELVAEFEELDVLALAVAPDGTLLAGTSPDGRVYRVSADGDTEVFFDPDGLYIWDMQFDAAGRLLVATGEDGIIYRVDVDGEAEVFYDSDNTHILTLAVDAGGNVIAGGSPRGYVYRIDDAGRAFVLYDSGMREVRSIALAPGGEIYAAVLDGAAAGSSANGSVTAAAGAISTIVLNVPVPVASPLAQDDNASGTAESNGTGIGASSGLGPSSGAAESRILEILPDGAVTTVWESDSELVLAVLYEADALYYSSGTRGRIYSLSTSRRPTLLVESTEEQTTRLLVASGRLLAASSNQGKLWELTEGARTQGVYQSAVRDTGAVSTWGKLAWVGDGVRVATRSGNTASPDATWSDWAEPGAAGDVASPPARFVQWQAVLDQAEGIGQPRLSSVTLPYLQQNFRPDISSLQLLRPGLALRQQQTANNPTPVEQSGISGRVVPPLPRPSSRTLVEDGAQALRWTASDKNDDVLTYSMFYRAENEADWKLLVEGLRDTFYTIEPDTLPDGMYLIRLVASDIGSNPATTALAGEFTTRPFAIDNTPPVVTLTATGTDPADVTLGAVATDQTSTLKQAEMSVDGGSWVPLFPVDGIVDSLREEFRFASGPLESGEHVISFRIYDQNENVGIGKTIVQIPR